MLGGPSVSDYASAVAAADLDGDGDQDLASANPGGGTLTVFLQTSPGAFDAALIAVGDPAYAQPVWVTSADLDGDGDQDLVSGNSGSHTLTIFFQSTPGTFDAAPLNP